MVLIRSSKEALTYFWIFASRDDEFRLRFKGRLKKSVKICDLEQRISDGGLIVSLNKDLALRP